ncbi:myo-inositol-1(or 4)-monophosphatase [Prevotella sp. tc2-28]|uniref:inositol monophosphatase family protein n=1 Tax=Prevotella sp. tc2-28 TaxID=1761888 RepID=UPI000899E70D|nr:inositol monophosphatase family protein [Prevotella sp. tc2-28]SEA93385.1 myo-inositol-1(or 4)-monophosphatase [Prevotella sp. tc2-28]
MENLEKITRLVCAIAREAGSYIRKERAAFSLDKVERKHAHDYVSYVDKGSERLIVSRLREVLPEAGFITEEGSAGHTDEQYVWVVDPLDGTTNFIHGFAPYAVSIALCKGREIMIGVVYEIVADECFYAWKGGGAYLEVRDKRLEVRDERLEVRNERLEVSKSTINDALLCLQLPYNSDAYKPVITRLIQHYYGQVGSIRMIGSAAIALCYVAAGRLDAYAERYIGQWDYMAGALIVMEAKGSVTNYAGDAYFMEGDSVVASNGVVHQDLLICTRNA